MPQERASVVHITFRYMHYSEENDVRGKDECHWQDQTEIIFRVTSFYQLPVSFHDLIRENMTENKNEDIWD